MTPLKAIEDEYSGLKGAKVRFHYRMIKARRAACIRCPKGKLNDAVVFTRVRLDGSYNKQSDLCLEHLAYFKQRRNK
jgi:hypothetical protein